MGFFFTHMIKKIISTGAAFAGIAVVLGALGAHGLKPLITTEQLLSYETAVRYQMYHAFALMILAVLSTHLPQKNVAFSFYAFVIGVLLFSGSIYLLSLHDLIGLQNYKWLGPITPLGGVSFICGWISIFIGALKIKN